MAKKRKRLNRCKKAVLKLMRQQGLKPYDVVKRTSEKHGTTESALYRWFADDNAGISDQTLDEILDAMGWDFVLKSRRLRSAEQKGKK